MQAAPVLVPEHRRQEQAEQHGAHEHLEGPCRTSGQRADLQSDDPVSDGVAERSDEEEVLDREEGQRDEGVRPASPNGTEKTA